MFPSCRTEGDGFSMPTFDVVPSDVEGFMDERWEFPSAFHDGFGRSEPRAHFFDSLVGQCSHLARKSIEPMALQVEGGNIRGLQRFIRDDVWDEEQMRWHSHHLVADAMGAPDGVLMFAESGLVKKGTDSVGVARQYGGSLGKVEQSHVGGGAAQASCHGQARVDKRLFLPEQWFAEDDKDRRATCQVPEEATWHTTPPLAAALVQAMAHEGLVPCKSMVADGGQGQSPAFLDAVDACVGVTALVAIASETRCWLQAPRTTDKMSMEKGAWHAKRVVGGSDHAPSTVAAWAARLPASSWQRRKVSEGTKGPIAYACARPRVTLSKEGLPERTVWLVIQRT